MDIQDVTGKLLDVMRGAEKAFDCFECGGSLQKFAAVFKKRFQVEIEVNA